MANNTIPVKAVRKQVLVLTPVYASVFLQGCAGGWVSSAIYFFTTGREVSATLVECSWMASLGEIGRMVSVIPAGMIFDKCSRRNILIALYAFHLTSWLLLSLSVSIYVIFLSRFLVGIASALGSVSSSTIMGEITSAEIRGTIVSSAHIANVCGSLFVAVVTSLFSSYKIVCYSATVLSFICLFPLFWFEETPHYLISISKNDQAKQYLRQIRPGCDEESIDIEFKNLKNYIEEEQIRKNKVSWLEFLSSKPIRVPIITLMLINSLASMTGGTVISSYITVIVPDIESISKKYYPLILQVISIVASFLAPVFIDKFSRKFLYSLSTIMCCFIAIFMALIYHWYELHVENYIKWSLLVGNLVIVAIWHCTIKPIQITWKSELFPHAVKGLACSLTTLVQSSCTVIAYKSYVIVTDGIGVYFNYLFYAVNLLLSFVVVFHLIPESRGKSLSDLQTSNAKNEPKEKAYNETKGIA